MQGADLFEGFADLDETHKNAAAAIGEWYTPKMGQREYETDGKVERRDDLKDEEGV